MKRKMCKRLRKILVQEWSSIYLVVVTIIVGAVVYNFLDTTPRTVSDYNPLKEQMTAIENNPAVLKKIVNCDIKKRGGVYTLTLFNKECEIVKKIDQNFKAISKTEEVDKSTACWEAILVSSWFGALFAGVTCIFLEIRIDNILERRKEHKCSQTE